jgi:hypothetical protein
MRIQRERTPVEWFVQGLTAGVMYLQVVGLPSVPGSTAPMIAAGQAALAAGALSNMLIWVNSRAQEPGVESDLDKWMRGNLLEFVRMAKNYRRANAQNPAKPPGTAELQRAVDEVDRDIQQQAAWARMEDVNRGPSATRRRRRLRAWKGSRPTAYRRCRQHPRRRRTLARQATARQEARTSARCRTYR